MEVLKALRSIFEDYKLEAGIPTSPVRLYAPIISLLSNAGKQLRPLITLLGCHLYDEEVKNALPAALAIEYFHNFTLIHDDVMDDAPIRRGQPTVYKKYGANTAILSGDALLILAYKELAKIIKQESNHDIFDIFNQTALEVCEGQQYDINFESKTKVTLEEYIKMITLKTSVLMGAGLQVGSIIGGAGKEESKALYEYGKNLGIAFQIQDDILDCYGDTSLTGKQKAGDIIQNKKTFLLIKALEMSHDNNDDTLDKILAKSNWNSPKEKVDEVLKIYDRYNIKEQMNNLRDTIVDKSRLSLNILNLTSEKHILLERLIDLLVYRKY